MFLVENISHQINSCILLSQICKVLNSCTQKIYKKLFLCTTTILSCSLLINTHINTYMIFHVGKSLKSSSKDF